VGLALTAALLLALAFSAWRLARRIRLRRRLRALPGATPERAIAVERFDEIDALISARGCHCGGGLRIIGEGSERSDGVMLRSVRAECAWCEEIVTVYFDVTGLFH
jgi:hypothetical protein